METKIAMHKNQIKYWFSEEINEVDKPLSKLTKREKYPK